MNEQLNELLLDLETAKKEFLHVLDTFPQDRIGSKPAEGWSASQVSEHILIAEFGTLSYMKKKTSGGWKVLEKTGETNIAASNAVNERLASPERFAAPSVLPEPSGAMPLDEINMKWNMLRAEMDRFIRSLTPEFYDRLLFRQPNAGLLNLYQAIQFMTHHIAHHIPQLERIKQDLHIA